MLASSHLNGILKIITMCEMKPEDIDLLEDQAAQQGLELEEYLFIIFDL